MIATWAARSRQRRVPLHERMTIGLHQCARSRRAAEDGALFANSWNAGKSESGEIQMRTATVAIVIAVTVGLSGCQSSSGYAGPDSIRMGADAARDQRFFQGLYECPASLLGPWRGEVLITFDSVEQRAAVRTDLVRGLIAFSVGGWKNHEVRQLRSAPESRGFRYMGQRGDPATFHEQPPRQGGWFQPMTIGDAYIDGPYELTGQGGRMRLRRGDQVVRCKLTADLSAVDDFLAVPL